MERKIYATPRTKLFSVELEGTFAGSVVKEDPQSGVTTSGQAIGIDKAFGESGDDAWNNGEGWN